MTGPHRRQSGSVGAFLWDLRRTAQELVIEQHADISRSWAAPRASGLSIEPYDMNPAGDLTLGGRGGCADGGVLVTGIRDSVDVQLHRGGIHRPYERSADCGGRSIYGRSLRRPGSSIPASLKDQGDWAFCAGINRFVFPPLCTPAVARPPAGHDHGAVRRALGTHADRGGRMVQAYHEYLARCQYLLRQGKSRGRHLLPGSRRRTARVSCPAVGARRLVRRPAWLQLRRLCARSPAGERPRSSKAASRSPADQLAACWCCRPSKP